MSTTLNAGVNFGVNLQYATPFVSLADTSNPSNIAKRMSFLTGVGGGQANRAYAKLYTIAASGAATININSLTDLLNLSLNFVRLKAVALWLVSVTDDTNGSACTSVVMDAASTFLVGTLFDVSPEIRIYNGAFALFAVPSAAGWTSAGANSLVINNEDAVNDAKLMVALIGADS